MSKNNSKPLKWINWFFLLIFSFFTYVQFNDPDPYIWVLIYGSVAILFGLSSLIKVPVWVLKILIAVISIIAVFHLEFFYDWLISEEKSELFGEMVYTKPYIEGTREFFGLLIAILALLYLHKNSE
ncbi:transmembrane 220 family protein [Lutimonas saemankumensis]|uniref:transmembrane 220 family protein n=1 Tax=Lutimonas saemankumensis TaxID=483016 RepID=UPI001CD1F149|nr:transmembrane 220 family protein [Lutimonas saemankumensis]MCA0933326.1 transmembrane 220 family protein [Lutimonas saemankumensis]